MILYMLLMLHQQRIEVRVEYPDQAACVAALPDVAKKTRRWASLFSVELKTAECRAETP
jgi:hypothetical protein